VADVDEVGGAAGLGGIQVTDVLQAHVVDHGEAAEARRVAGAEIAVDVVLAEPCIGERADGALGVELRGGLVGSVARRVLKRAHDVGLALDAHDLPEMRTQRMGDGLSRSSPACHPGKARQRLVRDPFALCVQE